MALETVVVSGAILLDEREYYTVQAASADIERHFEQAGRLLGNGLHMAYWKAKGTRPVDEVRVEVAVLAQDAMAMKALETLAATAFDAWFEQHKHELIGLKEARRQHYEKLRLATAVPQAILWTLPDSIDFHLTPGAPFFDKHLYVDDKGKCQMALGAWEETDHGVVTPMFPDLLIVRQVGDGYRFDILEPHDPSREDNAVKAVGLAQFAEKHWALFDRIQLIRKQKGPDGKEHFYRLDVGKDSVRKQVLAIVSNDQLDGLFAQLAGLR